MFLETTCSICYIRILIHFNLCNKMFNLEVHLVFKLTLTMFKVFIHNKVYFKWVLRCRFPSHKSSKQHNKVCQV